MCTDVDVHRRRLDGRVRGIPGWYEVDWADVERARGRAEPWLDEHLVLDAVAPFADNLATAQAYVA